MGSGAVSGEKTLFLEKQKEVETTLTALEYCCLSLKKERGDGKIQASLKKPFREIKGGNPHG